ncbi:DUF6907 domain-containing protein [Streptomyces californicus]|uniref:DUF6907 domain-containing protein n=1 Tax=Streptomyces californicus TaxID=67351 RepID=UPI00296FA797|nr:hypothetical protein [Streptomyces californicus]MDW4913756.1 hypothetical protein [Streptomyces californicus]
MPNTSRSTVPASFKPSGGIVTPPAAPDPLESGIRSAFDQGEPVVEKQPITYTLRNGGVLVETCPSWCAVDHADDIEGLFAEDLSHEGAEIELRTNTIEGSRVSILAARITQFPFSTDGSGSEAPYMALRPESSMGEALGYSTPEDVEAEIARVEAHLRDLRALNARLVNARAEHERRQSLRPENLSVEDVRSLPVSVLLKAFGLKVVEVGSMPHGVRVWLDRGAVEPAFFIDRTVPQAAREAAVRASLVLVVEAMASKAAGQ